MDNYKSNSLSYTLYKGDNEYCIDATGDACVGDEVCFERALFTGSFSKPKFNGYEKIQGKIIKDSYGKEKQQHTFTIELDDGEKILIKGRNLYRNGLYRKPWIDEASRKECLDEKHKRGNEARMKKAVRKNNPIFIYSNPEDDDELPPPIPKEAKIKKRHRTSEYPPTIPLSAHISAQLSARKNKKIESRPNPESESVMTKEEVENMSYVLFINMDSYEEPRRITDKLSKLDDAIKFVHNIIIDHFPDSELDGKVKIRFFDEESQSGRDYEETHYDNFKDAYFAVKSLGAIYNANNFMSLKATIIEKGVKIYFSIEHGYQV